MTKPEIFQEYDCAVCGIDFDLWDNQIVAVGEKYPCSGCWGYHVAGVDGPEQTAIRLSDGELHWRDLPKNAEEKAAWIEEAKVAAQCAPSST